MQLKKSLLGLLVVAVALSLFTVYAGAFAPTETQTITSAYGSRFSTNPEDWFADGYNTTQPVYEMPDKNNTGHVTPKDELVPFAEKYPDVPFKTSAGGVTYTINAATAKKYNNVFQGFILEKGCFTVDLPEGDAVVFRDFYLDAGNALGSAFGAPRKLNIGRTIILDAELQGSTHALITGINTTLKRCYLHHCWADHIKGFAGQIIMSNYFTEGGLNGGNPHPDCIQFSVDDGHGKGLDTENVYIIGNRFDNMITDVNKTNCCIIIKSEFGGGIRNLQVRNNWFNGGGTCMQVFVNEKYPMKFYEGVVISDNLFGVGSTYNVDIMYGNDTDGVSLSKKVTATNNQKITKPVVSTIVYTSDGERVYDVADLTGAEKKVTAYVSNYVTSAVDVLVQATLVGPDGKVLKTTFTQESLAKYLRP
ncbi:MAG: hypothetical protein J6R42_04705, partial [Clostridia bacterium]|nr:hypothetical protein [Clostridia bacterium]